MSDTLELVCVECRGEILLGRLDGIPEPPPWSPGAGWVASLETVAYFLVVHRGHVLGTIDSTWIDRLSPEEHLIEYVDDDELRALHPQTGLWDAGDRAAQPVAEAFARPRHRSEIAWSDTWRLFNEFWRGCGR